MSIEIYDINALLFFLGSILFIIGALINIRFWLLGSDSVVDVIKSVLRTIFSRKLYFIIKGFIVYLLGKRRLARSGKLRAIEKSVFVIFYATLILVNHIFADIARHATTLFDIIREFFYSPFFPAYIFTIENWQHLGWIKAYFFIDNLCMVMVVFFAEILLIVRRFHEKYYTISTLEDKLLIFVPIIWLILRFFGEASSIIYYNVPSEYSSYMFVAHVFSYLLYPIAQITGPYALYSIMWLLSGISFMIFIAIWPYTKLWHAFSGSLTILINSVEEMEHG